MATAKKELNPDLNSVKLVKLHEIAILTVNQPNLHSFPLVRSCTHRLKQSVSSFFLVFYYPSGSSSLTGCSNDGKNRLQKQYISHFFLFILFYPKKFYILPPRQRERERESQNFLSQYIRTYNNRQIVRLSHLVSGYFIGLQTF